MVSCIMISLDPGAAPAGALVAFAVTRTDRLLLRCGGPERWRPAGGYTLIPCELPGMALPTGADPADTAERLLRLTHRLLGVDAHMQSSMVTYGPSPAHRIDRLPPSGEAILPLLRLARLAPMSTGVESPRELTVRVYLATIPAQWQPPAMSGAWLWLGADGLRSAMRGLPFAELLAMPHAEWHTPPATPLPDDAFVYVPSEYGERHLLRILAKYGHAALFQSDPTQGDRSRG
jgi:hypothetical protein